MKRLLLLFTALPLLVTACFNHTASLVVGDEGLRALVQSAGAQQTTRPQDTRLGAPAVQQDPTNETSAGESTEDNKIILTVSLTGDVRGNYYVTVDERRLRTNGDSCEIDNLPVGARVTVGVSVHIGDTRYVQKEAKTITLAAGTNSVDIELVEAKEPLPQLEGTVTAGDERIITRTVGESVSFQYNNSDVSEAVIHINDLPTDGVTARSGQEELDISSGTVTGAPGGSVTLIFNKAGIYTVTAWAAKDGYAPTTPRTYTIIVNKQLEGTINATAGGTQLSSNATIPTGTQVTFSYGGSDVTPTITVTGGVTSNPATFNTVGTVNVTVTAAAEGYKTESQNFNITVADFTIANTLTAGDGTALPTTTYNGTANTYLVGTNVTTLRVQVLAGTEAYTGGNIELSVTTNPDVVPRIKPASAVNGNWDLPLTSLGTGENELTVSAKVYGFTAATRTFNILKFADKSGTYTLRDTVRITNGSLTIAPTSAVTITAPTSGGAAFYVSGGGTLTLGGSVTIDGQNVQRNSALVTVNSTGTGMGRQQGTLNLKDNATIKGGNNSGNGGGVQVSGGSFTMDGGTISNNRANRGGGVYVYDSGGPGSGADFTMNGTAAISDNMANRGGGVYVANNGRFTMINGGGTISKNFASIGSNTAGDGVYVAKGGRFTPNGNPVPVYNEP